MKLLVLVLAVGAASADIGLTYRVPDTSYGVPSYQHHNADYNTGYTGSHGYSYKAENSAQAGYQGANLGQQNLGYQTGYQSGAGQNSAGYQTGQNSAGYQTGHNSAGYQTGQNSAGYQTGQNSAGYQTGHFQNLGVSNQWYNDVPQQSSQFSGNSQGGYKYQTSNEYQSSAVQKYQEYYNQWQQQPAQVFKHFYVHAAPEEPEEPKRRQPVVLPPPQKHYKIIFIKAPSQTVYTPQYIPVPQPNEEKTIVYVLVKKPGEEQDVVVPKLEQKPPAKPEVFFIKYNNKADSSAVINNIVSDYNKVNTVHFAEGAGNSGEYSTGSTGQYATGTTGQYSTGTGQYNQANSGHQFAQKDSSLATGLSNQGAYDANTATATAEYSTASAGYSAGVSDNTASSLNGISTSQGVPHETYGPPSFRV